jgi:hypothetical protein
VTALPHPAATGRQPDLKLGDFLRAVANIERSAGGGRTDPDAAILRRIAK